MDEFAPYKKKNGCFIVRNITPDRNKTIKIFHYPILFNETRDLLQIPGVAEADIRASLLKGELRHKILAKDIVIECSDIDLLQFNEDQKQFLMSAGIINGLEAAGGGGGTTIPYLFRQGVPLVGPIDGVNRIFTVPSPDKFINGTLNGNILKIQILHHGRALVESTDYIVSESAGVGTGYDTIVIVSFTPSINSTLVANYMVKA